MSSASSTSGSLSEMELDMPARGRGRGRGRSRGSSRGGSRSRSRSGSRGGSSSGRGRRSSPGQVRGRSSGRGRGRSSSRGRGTSSNTVRIGGREDRERVRQRMEEKTAYMKDVISGMEAEKLRDIVLKLVDREPGLLFDLVEGVDDGNGGSPSPNTGSPSWCRCGNCREMPTELERKCCNCLPRNCVSQRDEIDRLVLDPQVLAISNRYYREMLGRSREQIDSYNKMMRLCAYRNFSLFRHGRLGEGERRVIPSCCVWRIRDTYPSITGQYTGFIPGRYV